jgi:hypothetical protein
LSWHDKTNVPATMNAMNDGVKGFMISWFWLR